MHQILAKVYQQKSTICLDAKLSAALGVTTWADCFADFTLPPADRNNMQNWLNAVGSFVNAVQNPLSALASLSLRQLLTTEAAIARHVEEKTEVPLDPEPSRVLAPYPVLVPGMERKPQTKLGPVGSLPVG